MAFILKQSDSYTWRVEFTIPGDNKHEKQSFDAQFRRLSTAEIVAVQADLAALENAEPGDALKGGIQACRKLVIGWDGIDDGTGDSLPFSDANLGKLLEVPGVMTAIIGAWLKSLVEAPAKN